MAETKKKAEEIDSRPPLTPESKENQLISLALDLVEQRLRDGTATSQETTHFLKLASTKARLEQEIMQSQKELIDAKAEAIHNQQDDRTLFTNAIEAFQSYSGKDDDYDY